MIFRLKPYAFACFLFLNNVLALEILPYLCQKFSKKVDKVVKNIYNICVVCSEKGIVCAVVAFGSRQNSRAARLVNNNFQVVKTRLFAETFVFCEGLFSYGQINIKKGNNYERTLVPV